MRNVVVGAGAGAGAGDDYVPLPHGASPVFQSVPYQRIGWPVTAAITLKSRS
jgi:hypothetical protein